jgi:hypothetical protein
MICTDDLSWLEPLWVMKMSNIAEQAIDQGFEKDSDV